METGVTKSVVLLAVLASVLFGINLGGYDLWPPDEPRFAEVAREMMASGDYLVPRVNGEVYREKPPLLFWAIAACSLPFGEVTPMSARMPSLLAAIATVVLTYLVGARLHSRRVGFWAAVVLMTGFRFWWQARTGQIDMLLTACTAAGFYALCRWDADRKAKWLLLLYAATAAGMLAKGPPALVFPLLFAFAFYWKDWASLRKLHLISGVLFASAVTLVWFIPARMAVSEAAPEAAGAVMAGDLFRNTIGRMFLGVSKAQMPWYYLTTLPADWLPWTVFLPYTLLWTWRRRKEPGTRFLWHWVVPALIFFSIIIGKRAIYILPLFPAMAILIAASALNLMEEARPVWRRRTAAAWALLLSAVALAPLALPFTEHHEAFTDTGPVLGLLLIVAAAVWFAINKWKQSLHGVVAVSMGAVLIVAGQFAFPIINDYKSAKAFCAPVRELAEAGEAFDLYSVGFSREEYIFYAGRFHEEAFTGLVGAESIAAGDLLEAAKQQKDARRLIEKAVEDLPVENIGRPKWSELAAMREAIEAAAQAQTDVEAIHLFEADLRAEVSDFAARFLGETPAFMFVQEGDWRWLLALQDDTRDYALVHRMSVGSREVLLIANPAGRALLMK